MIEIAVGHEDTKTRRKEDRINRRQGSGFRGQGSGEKLVDRNQRTGDSL